jgi:hypothetical protein
VGTGSVFCCRFQAPTEVKAIQRRRVFELTQVGLFFAVQNLGQARKLSQCKPRAAVSFVGNFLGIGNCRLPVKLTIHSLALPPKTIYKKKASSKNS